MFARLQSEPIDNRTEILGAITYLVTCNSLSAYHITAILVQYVELGKFVNLQISNVICSHSCTTVRIAIYVCLGVSVLQNHIMSW